LEVKITIMHQIKQTPKLWKMSEIISKELEYRTNCSVITTTFTEINVLMLYVFMDSDGKHSTADYKIVICNLIEHVTDSYIYVNYLMNCLNSKVFVQGNMNSEGIVIYQIITGSEGVGISFRKIDDSDNQGEKEYLYLNEFIRIKALLEEDIFIIEDKSYARTLINCNINSYYIDEVA